MFSSNFKYDDYNGDITISFDAIFEILQSAKLEKKIVKIFFTNFEIELHEEFLNFRD